MAMSILLSERTCNCRDAQGGIARNRKWLGGGEINIAWFGRYNAGQRPSRSDERCTLFSTA